MIDPRILALAEGADERRKQPAIPDEQCRGWGRPHFTDRPGDYCSTCHAEAATEQDGHAMTTDPRVARIERGIADAVVALGPSRAVDAAAADLYAWQEIARRHSQQWDDVCPTCIQAAPCPDRQAADAALDRLDALWGVDD